MGQYIPGKRVRPSEEARDEDGIHAAGGRFRPLNFKHLAFYAGDDLSRKLYAAGLCHVATPS
jgi:hypothetical protein